MEIILNLVWVGISAALLCLLLIGNRKRHSRNVAVIVFGSACILCLLFPVISMTDDLNYTPAILESAKLKKVLHPDLLPLVLLLAWFSSLASMFSGGHVSEQHGFLAHRLRQLFTLDLLRRPPPVASLVL